MKKIICGMCLWGMVFTASSEARNIFLQGYVKDAKEQPVSSASIYPEDRTADVTLTDENGYYELRTDVDDSVSDLDFYLVSGTLKVRYTLHLNPNENQIVYDWILSEPIGKNWYIIGKPVNMDEDPPENWVALYQGEPLREEDASFIMGPMNSSEQSSAKISIFALSPGGVRWIGSEEVRYEGDEYTPAVIEIQKVEDFPQDVREKVMSLLQAEEIHEAPAVGEKEGSEAAMEVSRVPGTLLFIDGPSVRGKLKKKGLVVRFVDESGEVKELTEKEAFFHLKNQGYIDSRGTILDKLVRYLEDIEVEPEKEIRDNIQALFSGLDRGDVETVQHQFSEQYWGDSFFRSYEQVPGGIVRLLGATEGMKFDINIQGISNRPEKNAYEARIEFKLMKGEEVRKHAVLTALYARDDKNRLKLVKIAGIRFIREQRY